MSTVYSVRSSAVRAAKKACGPDQEWVITPVGEGFTFTVLDVEEKQPKVAKAHPLNIEAAEREIATRAAEGEPMENAYVDPVTSQVKFNHNNAEGRKAAAVALGKKLAVTEPADRPAVVAASGLVKPFQLAKKIVSECVSRGITSRKEIMAACLAQGIKANTADGAHYELCVRKS